MLAVALAGLLASAAVDAGSARVLVADVKGEGVRLLSPKR